MNSKGTLHFFCGKMAAGKSTKAAEIAREHEVILLSEDNWLKMLYAEEIRDFDDYIHYSARLKLLMVVLVTDLLNTGVSVVMDFPGNTRNQRSWFKDLYSANQFPHVLHYLEVDDELCIQQLKLRSAGLPKGTAFTTEAEFHQINSYFQAPSDDEGFNMQVYRRNSTGMPG